MAANPPTATSVETDVHRPGLERVRASRKVDAQRVELRAFRYAEARPRAGAPATAGGDLAERVDAGREVAASPR
jgi:hypothetical protein